ncbi:Abi family protein [Weissella confusa]|uniref:Abi family protein n=1 Tax=Weissella confusa TaxID=1583 RepID=UPI00280A5D65|nr:Abi family protein [Weissella confusa]
MSHPYTSMTDLVMLAESKHNVTSINQMSSENFLKTFSYYTLINGYQKALESPEGSEHFPDGFTIENLSLFQLNESLLASNILWLVLSVEKKFKTLLQDEVSRNYGVLLPEYLSSKHYNNHGKLKKNGVIKQLRAIATGFYDLKATSPYTNDHPSNSTVKYRAEGNVPPWILVNELTFGEAIKWFDIMDGHLRRNIASNFKIGIADSDKVIEFFSMALDLIRQYRNGLAHGDVINKITSTTELNWIHIEELFADSIISKSEFTIQNIGKSDLFALFMALSILAPEMHQLYFKNDFNARIDGFNQLFDSDTSVTRRLLNLPNDFERRIDEMLRLPGA